MEKHKKLAVTEEEKSINIVDLFVYLVVHWKWYLLSILLFGGCFWYIYCKTPFTYSRVAIVMIKTPANSRSTMQLNNSDFTGLVNVASEILQFKSKELMRKVIDRLQANISYTVYDGLRPVELYTESPVRVTFLDAGMDEAHSLSVTPKSRQQVELADFSRGMEQRKVVNLNDTIHTALGRLIVFAAENYGESSFGKPVLVTCKPPEEMVSFWLYNLAIKQMSGDAALLHLTMNDLSPTRAADILDMLITIYNEEAIKDKNRIAVNTAEFIKERLQIIEHELGSVETDIEDLKRANNGVDIDMAAGMYIQDSREYESSIKELDTQLQLVTFIKQYLQDSSKEDELIPSNIGLEDLNIETQISRYNETLLRRNRLMNGSSSNNPVVQELNRTMQTMKLNIYRALDNLSVSLRLKKQDYSLQENRVRQKVQAVPRKQREMLSIERQQKVKESLYIFLLNKREENALSQAMVDNNARVLDPVSGSNIPISPNKYKKLLLGVGCGVIVPSVILLLMLMLDTGVHNRKEIESIVSAPFLADIPQTPKAMANVHEVVVRARGLDALSESFRILRTNLGFMLSQTQERKVITLTSFNIGAGKTFISINLAASLVQTEKKIVLLDLDLRKGKLSEMAHCRQVKGVAHYLSDSSVEVTDIIVQDTFGEGLDLVPIGVIAPNPTELLLSKRLDKLVAELKERYDYIIVDNVPIGLVADATVVNRITDLTLFIVRVGKIDRRQLPELERLYQEHKLNNMAVVLNGTEKGSSGYGYGYGYNYGYGYAATQKKKGGWWRRKGKK